MDTENKERLLDDEDVYKRLRKCSSVLQMNNEELAEKFGISKAYLQKMLSGKNAISGSAIKAFIIGGLDVQYIFTGQSDRDEINKLKAQIETLEGLIRKAYKGE